MGDINTFDNDCVMELREPYKGMYQDGLNSASRLTSCRVRTSGSGSSLLRSALWRNVTLLLFTGA